MQLVIAQVLAEFAGDATQVSERDAACAILIEQLERLDDLLNWVTLTNLCCHDFEEVRVLDLTGAITIVIAHNCQYLLFLDVEAEGTHGDLKLMIVDSASLISVEEFEGFFDLLSLLIGQLLTGTTLRVGQVSAISFAATGAKIVWFPEHLLYFFKFKLF